MKVSDEYEPYFLEKEQRAKFDKLYRKLMGFARKQFQNHYFRGEAGGIPPSGDAYEDFVIRAFIHCYPQNKPFKIDKTLEQNLYNYIRRQVSRESRLKINNLVKNESYYEVRNYFYNPFNITSDNRENARQKMIEKRVKQARKEIVQGFIKSIKDSELLEFTAKLTDEHAKFEELIKKITDNPNELIKELIKRKLVYDATGQATEKTKKLDRPCKMDITYHFKDKKAKRVLFSILNMNKKFNKPQFAAFYLDLQTDEYYKVILKLRMKFLEFFKEWCTGENAKLLKELGLFQDMNLKKC